MQGSALATGAFFINSKFSLKMLAEEPPSPFTTPWIQPLRFAPYAVPLPDFARLDPAPIPELHQRYEEFAPQHLYNMTISEQLVRPHPQLGFSRCFAYQGSVPGVTFMARYGTPVLCRINNALPSVIPGFGSCDVITHVHNGFHAPESDGFPEDRFSPGSFKDHHWPNMLASGNPLEAKGTLWYHDHCLDFTAQNTYRGLAGFYLLFDSLDSGTERDPNPDAFRLPSGVPDGRRVRNRYDLPLIFTDRRFDQNGLLAFDTMNMDGILGDKFLVNGLVQPYFEVERRKYRLRLLVGGPSRFFDFWMSNGMTFDVVAMDGNMLPTPIPANHVKLGVAERADIVVDFSQLPESTTEVYIVNREEQRDGRGPTGNTLPMSTAPRLLKLIVRPGQVQDPSRVPSVLRPRPAMDIPVAQERSWHFDRSNGMWTVNGQLFDHNRCDAFCKQGTAEIWHFSTAGGWAHPVHVHCEEPMVLSYNGKPVGGTILGGRKDIFTLYPGDEMSVYIKFRDWLGRYPMHCHNTVHEDHAMMVRWDIVP